MQRQVLKSIVDSSRFNFGRGPPAAILNPPRFAKPPNSSSSSLRCHYHYCCWREPYLKLNSNLIGNIRTISTTGRKQLGQRQQKAPVYTIESSEFCPPKTLERLRKRDGMPPSYELIYRSNFPNYLLYTQIIVFLTTGALIMVGIMMFVSPPEERTPEVVEKLKQDVKDYEEKQKTYKTVKAFLPDEEPTAKEKLSKVTLQEAYYSEDDPIVKGVMLGSLAILIVALFKLLRLLPVRIYRNKKQHCVAVSYGSILPGQLTHLEFLEGTLRSNKSGFGMDNVYKVPSGRQIILMEQFFRQPIDYNRLLGIDVEFADDVVKSRVKEGGSWNTRRPK